MPVTTLSSREVNQDLGRAKRASQSGPVIITDRERDGCRRLLPSPHLLELAMRITFVPRRLRARRLQSPSRPA